MNINEGKDFRPIKFSMKFDTIKSAGRSRVYMHRSHIIISKEYCISFSEQTILSSITNSVEDLVEMPHYVGFQSTKG